jgi:hypothetical protein
MSALGYAYLALPEVWRFMHVGGEGAAVTRAVPCAPKIPVHCAGAVGGPLDRLPSSAYCKYGGRGVMHV